MFAARATTIQAFEAIMSIIKEEDAEAYKWLMKKGPRHWTSNAFFRTTSQCVILLNNLCESFNGLMQEFQWCHYYFYSKGQTDIELP